MTEIKDKQSKLREELNDYIGKRKDEFDQINGQRKEKLEEIARHISQSMKKDENVKLVFICTHNSRRSHMAQLWAQAASCYYGIDSIQCYSGGTEATAFNPRSVKTLQEAGFHIEEVESGQNPVYQSRYSEEEAPVQSFSKKYSHPDNPQSGFTAIMVCSHADDNCPYVPGANARFALPYDDPKKADGQANEAAVYAERCRDIAREMSYIFSCAKALLF